MAALWFGAASASSQEVEDLLTPRLSPEAIQSAFPGAEEVGAAVGRPASLPVYVGGELVGYLFSTRDTVNTIGYSGFSFDLVAGVTLDGTITGTYMMNHREPIIGHGVPEELLTQYLGGFAAVTLGDARSISAIKPDHLRGATTTARLTRNGVLDAARLVYAGQVDGLFAPVTEPELDRIGFSAHSWEELIAGGSVTKYVLSNAQAEKMFARQVGRGALPDTSTDGPDDTFIEMYVGLVSATSIGSNLFGGPRFKGYLKDAPDDGLAVWIGGRGGFSWMGNAFYRAANRYEFDRVRIVQNDTEIVLTRDMFKRVKVANVPGSYMYESLVFFLPPGAGLDPLAPWHVEVTIPGTDGDGAAAALTVQVAYQLPERHMLLPPPPPPPVWLEAWTDKRAEISILVGMLMVLTLIFLFQDYLVRQRRVFSFVRVGFLAFTLG
ncbi:MAG: hypothetical protein HOB82_02555, partial [Alphaproteobacteria bacterium]|nr:hypothetical protein [Alphaproteobacteria bacterium]